MSKPVIKEPTDEQIKEFWEWCGFWYNEKEMGSTWVGGKWHHRTHYYDWRELPPIDLNNLFKYAVPFLLASDRYSIRIYTHKANNEVTIIAHYHGDVSYQKGNPDLALALFWAIYEVFRLEG